MNIEEIELRANISHKNDELNEIVNELPDNLRTRMCKFITVELARVAELAVQAKMNKDIALARQVHEELTTLDQMNDLQNELPDA